VNYLNSISFKFVFFFTFAKETHRNSHIGEIGNWDSHQLIYFVQRKVIMQVKTILEENIILMVSKKTNNYCWKVADLGCSSGPNTLMVISNIMNIINKITLKLNHVITPTFQIYLNDLFENDFNTIFKLLPDFYQQIKEENVGECFINATPGNFYGRLFPNNYIDFFHSSYCLHWLSQVSILNKTNLICINI
jgi:jasmonate O-methyltransferase